MADRITVIPKKIVTVIEPHKSTLVDREKYDDSIVRQMVECIKVYADKHIEVIFGGGYTVEETVE